MSLSFRKIILITDYTSVTPTRIVQILVGICSLASFVWGCLLWKFRLGSFVSKLRLCSFTLEFSLGYFAWRLSLEVFRFKNIRMRTFVLDLSLGTFHLTYWAWDVSLGNFRLGTFAWESLEISRLATSFGIVRFATFDRIFLLGIFRLGTFAS